jgi:type VI secretion system protein ImpM
MVDRHPGFFGKLPAHGDFIDRGLPRSFITPWDQWLQGCIANSRELLGASWLDRYLVGPIWRFALAPRVCGEQGWRGMLLPSVDRVNRYYPLTIAMPEADDVSPLAALTCCNDWFNACEDAALAALDPTVDAAMLALRLQSIGSMDPQRVRIDCPRFHAEGASAWQLELRAPQIGPGLDAIVAEALMQKDYQACSLWWSAGSETIEPSLLIHRGLPSIHDFAALLDGQWRQWGWATCSTSTTQPAAPASEGTLSASSVSKGEVAGNDQTSAPGSAGAQAEGDLATKTGRGVNSDSTPARAGEDEK